jgi:hypothetical protein
MKGDFTRSTFKKEKHYSSVRMQQGRVQMDADWNEQQDIQAHLRQTEAKDVIGSTGVPKYGGGFNIGILTDASDLTNSPGRIYVDGILCELEAAPVTAILCKSNSDIQIIVPVWIADGQEFKNNQCIEIVENSSVSWLARITAVNRETLTLTIEPITQGIVVSNVEKEIKLFRITTYFTQQDYPGADPGEINIGTNLVYLDVWQRHITALDDEYIREKALGGPDTASRTKTVWQVKLQPANASECSQVVPGWQTGSVKSDGKLSARAAPGEESDDPCILPPQAGYRRLENQLYRVEIHESGTESIDNPTFKWSRDNGSIAASVKAISGKKITISHPVPGRLEEFAPGQWIEVNDDKHELRGEPGTLVQIESVAGNELTLYQALSQADFPEEYNPKIRRWDCNGEEDVKIAADNDGYLKLEDGVEIKFEPGKYYQTGDYWLIPARSATGGIEWPGNVFKSPEGIKHHYCKLALVNYDNNSNFQFIQDCRPSFPPLNEIKMGEACCDVTVGDGKSSFGDVDSIQDAFNKVKPGGNICLLPGVHRANLEMKEGKNIAIKGCGKNTFVIPTPDNEEDTIFHVEDSVSIAIENINFVTLAGTAIALKGTAPGKLKEIEIRGCRIIAFKHAIRVEQGTGINIMDNEIGMIDRDGGEAAIYMLAESSQIGQNDIGVIPTVNQTYTFPDGSTAPYPHDPQLDRQTIYNHVSFKDYVYWLWNIKLNQTGPHDFDTRGGIQIASGSVDIRINENRINGGLWNGITLGSLPYISENLNDGVKQYALDKRDLKTGEEEELKNKFNSNSLLENIKIEGNEIINMGGNGIGVRCFFKLKEIPLLYTSRELAICGNTINNCLQQILPETGKYTKAVMGYGGIALADCENLVIRENRVENNGNDILQPVSGIFILQGEDIDISDNRVFNNGPGSTEDNNNYMQGARGGIVIVFSFLRAVQVIFKDMQAFDKTNVSLTKIHDNIVKQPLGQALFLIAFGPVSIVGNHLMSQGIDIEACTLARTAGAVLVLNFGVSKDYFAVLLLTAIKNIGNTGFASQMKASNVDTASYYEKLWQKLEHGFLYLPGGNILFSNNQTTLKLHTRKIDYMVSSQFIFSLDDISYSANQSECAAILDIVVANSIVFGITVRANDNRFQEGITGTLLSLLSFGLMNSTTFNQGTNCIHVLGLPIYKVDPGNKTVYPDQYCGLILKLLARQYAKAWLAEEDSPDEVAGEDTPIIKGIKRFDEKGGYVFETRRISKCEMIGWLNDSLDQVERLRGENLDKLYSMQTVKDTAAKIEYKSLSAELGKDHPKVKILKARIDYNANMFKELDEIIVRTKTKKPGIDDKTWVVHGMAIDKNRKGVKGLTVALYNEKGEYLKDLGIVSTNENGYFSTAYSPKDVKRQYDESTKVFVKVINKEGKVLYQTAEPMFIKFGTIETLDIDIPGEEEIIAPPGSEPEPGTEPEKQKPEPEPEKQKPEPEPEEKQTEQKQTGATPEKDQWLVEGIIKDEKNKPGKGITVRLYDTKHLFDQRLGSQVTDKKGKFKFSFKGEDFQALNEAKADIHLEVVDDKGKAVYTSPEAVRCEPGHVDVFDIQLPPRS